MKTILFTIHWCKDILLNSDKLTWVCMLLTCPQSERIFRAGSDLPSQNRLDRVLFDLALNKERVAGIVVCQSVCCAIDGWGAAKVPFRSVATLLVVVNDLNIYGNHSWLRCLWQAVPAVSSWTGEWFRPIYCFWSVASIVLFCRCGRKWLSLR